MNDKEAFYDQIEAFLSGHLGPEKREAMQKAMSASPALAREVELRRLEFDVSEALIAQNIRDQLLRLRTPPSPEPPPAPLAERQFSRRILWIIAALLVGVAIGVYWWNRADPPTWPNTEQVPSSGPEQMPLPPQDASPTDQAPIPTESLPSTPENAPEAPKGQSARQQLALATSLYQRPDMETLRGTVPMTDSTYERALSAWEKRDYAAIVAALQNISTNDPKWIRVSTPLAHAQFNLRRFATAAQSFAAIADSRVMPWSEEAEWYVLLALLADGKEGTVHFRSRLKKLLADKGHPYFEAARGLQVRLEGGIK